MNVSKKKMKECEKNVGINLKKHKNTEKKISEQNGRRSEKKGKRQIKKLKMNEITRKKKQELANKNLKQMKVNEREVNGLKDKENKC